MRHYLHGDMYGQFSWQWGPKAAFSVKLVKKWCRNESFLTAKVACVWRTTLHDFELQFQFGHDGKFFATFKSLFPSTDWSSVLWFFRSFNWRKPRLSCILRRSNWHPPVQIIWKICMYKNLYVRTCGMIIYDCVVINIVFFSEWTFFTIQESTLYGPVTL